MTNSSESVDKAAVRQRKRLEELVTLRSTDAMVRHVTRAFESVDTLLPVANDREEEARRQKAYADAAVVLRRAALTYLRERERATFDLVLHSVVCCTREAIKTGRTVDFRIVRLRKTDTFRGGLANAFLLGAFNKLKSDLTGAWRNAGLSPAPFTPSHFVSQKGRFGTSQKLGIARRHAILDARAAAVLDRATELLGAEGVRHRPLTKDQVARWVRESATLTEVLHRFLGYLDDKAPRTIKLMLIEARKQAREAREYSIILEKKGWV